MRDGKKRFILTVGAFLVLLLLSLYPVPAHSRRDGTNPRQCLGQCNAAAGAVLRACISNCQTGRAMCRVQCREKESPSGPDDDRRECRTPPVPY